MIKVFTWLWSGWRDVYNHQHVNALNRMLRAHHTERDLQLTCIASKPEGIECATIPMLDDPPGLVQAGSRMNCFRRLRLFDPTTQLQLGIEPGDIVMNIDLDVLVRGSLLGLVKPLIGPGAVDLVGVKGRHALLNGSCWAFRAFTNWDIWMDFNPRQTPTDLRNLMFNGRRVVGSDQAWISAKLADRPYSLWDINDGVFQFASHGRYHRDRGILWAYAGGIKPWSTAAWATAPQLHAEYMGYFGKSGR